MWVVAFLGVSGKVENISLDAFQSVTEQHPGGHYLRLLLYRRAVSKALSLVIEQAMGACSGTGGRGIS